MVLDVIDTDRTHIFTTKEGILSFLSRWLLTHRLDNEEA